MCVSLNANGAAGSVFYLLAEFIWWPRVKLAPPPSERKAWQYGNFLNVIESGMQNKVLIFGMDPGLTYLKVLSTFCTRLHIQDKTLGLPRSVIDTSVEGAVKLQNVNSCWLHLTNVRMKTLIGFSHFHLSRLFSHFISAPPPLPPSGSQPCSLVSVMRSLRQFFFSSFFSNCCCTDWIFHFGSILFKPVLCEVVILTEAILGTCSFTAQLECFNGFKKGNVQYTNSFHLDLNSFKAISLLGKSHNHLYYCHEGRLFYIYSTYNQSGLGFPGCLHQFPLWVQSPPTHYWRHAYVHLYKWTDLQFLECSFSCSSHTRLC